MSREDDSDDIMDSPDETSGQADTSEPLVEDESVEEFTTVETVTVSVAPAAVESEEVKPAPKPRSNTSTAPTEARCPVFRLVLRGRTRTKTDT